MAQKTNSPIVPYAISGDYKLFSNNLKIVFGEPFYTDDRELSDANSELYHRVMKLLIENMSQSELKKKHITTFEEWSRKNEKAS
jgi:1-acyl-sn-glycerol-3-phosphate acyltransferase